MSDKTCTTCEGSKKHVTGSRPLGMTDRMANAPCFDCGGTGVRMTPTTSTATSAATTTVGRAPARTTN
jgi:DnaJ-class molecular chaperone